MITEHRIFNLDTLDHDKWEVEINYSANPSFTNAQVLRFKRKGEVFEVKRNDLTALLILVGDAETTSKLLPLKKTTIKKMERMLTFEFKAGKDYKKGEKIQVNAPWIDEVPTEEEILSGSLNRKSKFKA
jgi:hypothetical protein